MNKKQLQVNKKLLDEEKEVMKRLRSCYADAYKEVSKKVLKFSDNPEMISRIHQKKYHQALQKQIKLTLNLLDSGKVSSIDEFLNKTAETSFIGSLYEFNEDVPLLLPIDNKTISFIINKKVDDFSFSERLHGDTKKLTDVTVNEISRGFSTGMSFEDMALNIKNRFTHDMNNAFRIAQTEGHRVSQETAYDTAKRFKEKGADIVKQWDSTMDKKTRPHHVKLDGQIRELEDPFEVEGHKAMYPGAFGLASEDIRCRCVMVKRARWALEEDETKWDAEQDKLVTIKAKGYDEFKRKYEKKIQNAPEIKTVKSIESKSYRKYTEKEITEMVKKNESLLNFYGLPSTKWSGRIVNISDRDGGMKWNGDIALNSETSPFIVLHELLHLRSAGIYGKDMFKSNYKIEEASVNFLSQELSKAEHIEIIASVYDEMCDILRDINGDVEIYDNNLAFALELFKQPLNKRIDWIRDQVYDNAKDIEQISRIAKKLDTLE